MLNAALTSPFAMLLDLDSVVAEMERSERLQHLSRRVYHPLDKPLIPKAGQKQAQAGEIIDEIDEDDLS